MANIRTARRSGLVLRGGRNRRDTLWVFIAEIQSTLASAGSAVMTNIPNAALLATVPFTVVRVRGQMHVRSDQVVTTETQQVAWGAAVVSDQSVAIGVTAVPTPFTDMGSDLWFTHQMLTNQFLLVSGDGMNPSAGRLIEIDSRAMRKVEEGQSPIFVLENSTLSAGTVTITAARMLIKLH